MIYEQKTSLLSRRGTIEYFYWLPLKSIEINGVDTTGFLKIFVVLMYFHC